MKEKSFIGSLDLCLVSLLSFFPFIQSKTVNSTHSSFFRLDFPSG